MKKNKNKQVTLHFRIAIQIFIDMDNKQNNQFNLDELIKLAESGDAEVQFLLGYLYHEGIGYERSIDEMMARPISVLQ